MPSSASSSSLYIIRASSPLTSSDTDDDAGAGAGGALSRPVVERFASSFRTQESLTDLCKKHGIPKDFTPLLPGDNHRACSPPPAGSICVYAQALEAGMRFPLHPFFSEALTHFGVAPSQVAPNGWRVMAAFVVLSHFAGVPPSLPVFRHLFSLCAHKIKGWYGFRCKDSAGAPLFKGLPSFIKGWKEEFFFLKSSAPWPQQREFSAANPSDVIQSSYVTMLKAANRVCFSLGYALELEEKVAAREREADALRRELAETKAELAEAKEASAGGARRAAAENVLAGYERGMEDMKRAALRRYPHLDPDKLVVPPGGGGPPR